MTFWLASPVVRRRVLLHVGTRKSGTTYLQLTLRASAAALEAQGARLAVVTMDDYAVLYPPLRHAATPEETAAAAEGFAARTAGAAVEIVSMEALAELPEAKATAVVRALQATGADVEVVITARHWGLVLPSEWQQQVRERGTRSYPDFLTAVRDRSPEADGFLSRQDLPAVARRWADAAGREHVHLIACPTSGRPSASPDRQTDAQDSLVDLFCSVAGLDASGLSEPGREQVNQSLSLPQAEMLRRVNVALGERLPKDGSYKHAVRRWLTGDRLGGTRTPIRLPAEFAQWCAEESQRQYDALTDLGLRIVGRAEDLVAPGAIETGPASPPETEVTAIAIETIASLADQRWREVNPDASPAGTGRLAAEDAAVVSRRRGLFRR